MLFLSADFEQRASADIVNATRALLERAYSAASDTLPPVF